MTKPNGEHLDGKKPNEEIKREKDKFDAVIEMMREQVKIMREGQRVK